MINSELSLDHIQTLYADFLAAYPWPSWLEGHRSAVERFRTMSDATFAQRSSQEALWRAREVSSIGPGESVSVEGAYADSEVVQAFLELKHQQWPEDPSSRAAALQVAWARILALVNPKHAKQRPQAMLSRAFTTLVPEHLHTGFSWESHRAIARLLLGSVKVAPIEGAARARARLRAALGSEIDLDEHIRRAQFCWWLHENADAIDRNERTTTGVTDEPTDIPPPIALWPVSKQRKGFAATSGYVEALRAVVSVAEQGATSEDIVDSMRSDPEWAKQSLKTCRQLFNRVRRFGFLEHRDGLWFPSAEGEQLLQEDPPEILVEKLIVRIFGTAHLLRELRAGPASRAELVNRLQVIYPRWTTNMAPNMLIAWLVAVGLVESVDKKRTLTEYGRVWEGRLPPELPVPENEGTSPEGEEGEDETDHVDAKASTAWPTLAALTAAFRTDREAKGLVFTDAQIRALHLGWHCHPRKRFVLLSGLSGTGKTAILCHYARLYLSELMLEERRHLAVVPVSPDWRDPSGLLGYFNALHADPSFQAEPALRLVVAAARNPTLPYFLVLDEMNLARAELYFAPFLSAMESGRELQLHAHDETVNDVPPSIPWPTNLFVGGTVNMDETTHPFSDKVLDRAFTMEFWDVDLGSFLERRAGARRRHVTAETVLTELHDELRRVRRHFGYRTAGEVLDFLDHADTIGAMNTGSETSILDDALFAKVLPRLRGEESPLLREVLTAIRDRCAGRGLVRCAAKLDEMRERLQSTGMTRFWA